MGYDVVPERCKVRKIGGSVGIIFKKDITNDPKVRMQVGDYFLIYFKDNPKTKALTMHLQFRKAEQTSKYGAFR